MPDRLPDAIAFVVNTIAQLYLFVLLLRLLMPWFGTDFRNPIVQAILKLTSPVVVPLRRIVPPIGRIDTATVLVAFIIQYITIVVLLMIRGVFALATFTQIATTTVVNLVLLTLNLFIFAILIRVIMSWISPGGYNPILAVVHSLTNPVLRPFQRLLPSMGGLDLSPLFAMILLSALRIVIAGYKLLPV